LARRLSLKLNASLVSIAAVCTVALATTGNSVAFLFAAMFFMLVTGVPVALSLAGSSLLFVLITGQVPDLVVVHRMINGVDSFPLLAVPFFILAGSLMNAVGITDRIFAFATACVGWMHGGLGHVNIGASVIFAGMSGAAVADAGGLGTIEIKAMRDAGYDADFSVGVTAASSTIGPIIPPSLPMVIYGVMASASIGQLFAAGFIPGLLMAGALMLMVAWLAHKRAYPRDAAFSLPALGVTFKRAFMSLMTPIIIVGGILTGAFTPTEAAAAAVAWALFLGWVWYRTLNFRRFVRVSMETIETTAIITFIVAGASIFAWILTSNRVTEHFVGIITGITDNPLLVLLIFNVILFVVGFFMETIAAITILVPVMLPVATQVGIDPVHFGVIMVLNLMIGLLTPPVGMVLYVLSRVSGVSFERCTQATLPFLIPLVAVLLLVTFVPGFSLWLPGLIYR
jgi:tripartite ATP-independent transporter DctM subunit